MGKNTRFSTLSTVMDVMIDIVSNFNVVSVEVVRCYLGYGLHSVSFVLHSPLGGTKISVNEWDIRVVNGDDTRTIIPGVGDPNFTYEDALKCLITKAEDFLGESFHDLVPEFNTMMADI